MHKDEAVISLVLTVVLLAFGLVPCVLLGLLFAHTKEG